MPVTSSNELASIALAGRTPRGKYTLFNKFAFHRNVMLAVETEVEKKVQSTKPASANREYGTPPVVGCRMCAKIVANMAVGSNGSNVTQTIPRIGF
jgi:hypothetical protein